MEIESFDQWLRAYGDAWEARDARAFANLFTEQVLYYWTPFGEPKRGRKGVAEAFTAATERQARIEFEAQVLAPSLEGDLAHWRCSFDRVATGRRVHLDGIFLVGRGSDGLCHTFREWWHSDEVEGQSG